MPITSFRSNFRFAIHKEHKASRVDVLPNKIEQFGDFLSWIVYEFRAIVKKAVSDPRVITIFITLFAMVFTSLLFYSSITWDAIANTIEWVVVHINWEYVKFCLWILSEISVLGLGMRAFGRFSNKKLMAHYKIIS